MMESNQPEIENQKEILDKFASDIFTYPKRLKLLVENIPASLVNSSFKINGLTLIQFIHSNADYVLNIIIQLKLILTEIEPVIRPYHKERWIELPDSKVINTKISLSLTENIHQRMYVIIRNLRAPDLNRKYFDPMNNKTHTLLEFLDYYINECNNSILTIIQSKSLLNPRSKQYVTNINKSCDLEAIV